MLLPAPLRRGGGPLRDPRPDDGQAPRRAAAAAGATRSTWPAAWPASAASRLMSWLELPPAAWFVVAFAVAVLLRRRARCGVVWRRGVRRAAGRLDLARARPVGATPSGRRTTRSRPTRKGKETVVEVNNIFHQSMAPVRREGVLLPVAVHGVRRRLRGRADPRRRLGHGRRRRRCMHGVEADRRGRDRPGHRAARAASTTPTSPTAIRASTSSPTTPGTSCGRRRRSTTSWCSR